MRNPHRITTDRLIIRECYDVVMEHIEWLNDKELMQWSEQRWRQHDEDSQRQFLDRAYAVGSPLVFDIRRGVNDNDSKSIGSLHAHIDRRHKRTDLGIMLSPQYHGRGYAMEAWLAVETVLAAEGIRKFEAGCVSGNFPMRRLLQKMDYICEGIRLNHFNIDGSLHSLYLYGKEVE